MNSSARRGGGDHPRHDGRVVVITGGARGIGGTLVRELASAGASVIVDDLLEDGAVLAEQLGSHGHDVHFQQTDIVDAARDRRPLLHPQDERAEHRPPAQPLNASGVPQHSCGARGPRSGVLAAGITYGGLQMDLTHPHCRQLDSAPCSIRARRSRAVGA
jgi:hypothetical protein